MHRQPLSTSSYFSITTIVLVSSLVGYWPDRKTGTRVPGEEDKFLSGQGTLQPLAARLLGGGNTGTTGEEQAVLSTENTQTLALEEIEQRR